LTALLYLHPDWNPLAVKLSFGTCILCLLMAAVSVLSEARIKMGDRPDDGKSRGIVLRGGTHSNKFGKVVMNGVDIPITIEDDAHHNQFGDVNLRGPGQPTPEGE